jgi:DNA (cytosine-5)-methyltransferase 1
LADAEVVAAIDVWDLATKTYSDNFEGAAVYRRRCESVSAATIRKQVGPIDLIVASPECTSHTWAKGAARRSEKSRETAFQVVRFARILKPRWIVVENVPHMKAWRRYGLWLRRLERLGYQHREELLNAADFGVPQSRRRLFILFDRKQLPPEITRPKVRVQVPVRGILERNSAYRYSVLSAKTKAPATVERARRAVSTLGRTSFLMVYYGSDGAGGWQRLGAPLRTITTLDRFALVRPRRHRGYEMRMLQVPELQRAMGFPSSFKLKHGVRRDKIKLLGNAVCPPVMARIIRLLTHR